MSLAEGRRVALAGDRTVFDGVEYGEIDVPLGMLLSGSSLDIYPEVLGQQLLSIQLRKNSLVFSAGHFVGLIPVNDRVLIDVRPRVPANLARMLAIGGRAPKELTGFVRRYGRATELSMTLLHIYARALVDAMRVIEQLGIHRAYQALALDTTAPRGRIDQRTTMRRHWARGHRERFAVSRFEHAVDNAPNRGLKYVLWYLASLFGEARATGGVRRLIGDLNRLYRLFDQVHLDPSREFSRHRSFLEPERLPANRSYYRPALELARLIVDSQGIDLEPVGDAISLPPLLVNTEEAFEAYLREILRRRLAHLGSGIAVLDGNHRGSNGARKRLFDALPSEDATPDILVQISGADGNRLALVLEIKYIVRAFRSHELYQAISYAASYRAPCVLVRPSRDGTSGPGAIGAIDGLRIDSYVFDLGSDAIEDEELKFASYVAARLH